MSRNKIKITVQKPHSEYHAKLGRTYYPCIQNKVYDDPYIVDPDAGMSIKEILDARVASGNPNLGRRQAVYLGNDHANIDLEKFRNLELEQQDFIVQNSNKALRRLLETHKAQTDQSKENGSENPPENAPEASQGSTEQTETPKD